ncbi:MAG: hypothetical protein AB7G75_29070, partial [Candidatus Binatia bacterium]
MYSQRQISRGQVLMILVLGLVFVSTSSLTHAQNFPSNVVITTGNTPAVVLQQNTSGGFPARNWRAGANETQFFIHDQTGGVFPFAISAGAPQDSLFVNFNGRVGLGTQTPQGNLHISGVATADIFNGIGPNLNIGPAFNFGYSGFSFGRSSGFFNVRPDASATGPNPSLRFATQNLQRMIIDKNGNVGIGNFGADANTQNPGTSPSSLLHVKGGDIRVEGGSFIDDGTALNVPDYVFAPDYQLMPLKQLAMYIEREQHLPGIPSAQEIKAKGLNLRICYEITAITNELFLIHRAEWNSSIRHEKHGGAVGLGRVAH